MPEDTPTVLQRILLLSAAWSPRDGGAYMPILATVEGDGEDVVPAICRELADRLPWAILGETVIPNPAAPTGALTRREGEDVAGALIVSISPNQAGPEYGDGDMDPAVSPIRLDLHQTTTPDFADLGVLIARRRDVRRVLGELTGIIGG